MNIPIERKIIGRLAVEVTKPGGCTPDYYEVTHLLPTDNVPGPIGRNSWTGMVRDGDQRLLVTVTAISDVAWAEIERQVRIVEAQERVDQAKRQLELAQRALDRLRQET